MRKLFLGGNWKSNNLLGDALKLVDLYNKIKFDPNHLGNLNLTRNRGIPN